MKKFILYIFIFIILPFFTLSYFYNNAASESQRNAINKILKDEMNIDLTKYNKYINYASNTTKKAIDKTTEIKQK